MTEQDGRPAVEIDVVGEGQSKERTTNRGAHTFLKRQYRRSQTNPYLDIQYRDSIEKC